MGRSRRKRSRDGPSGVVEIGRRGQVIGVLAVAVVTLPFVAYVAARTPTPPVYSGTGLSPSGLGTASPTPRAVPTAGSPRATGAPTPSGGPSPTPPIGAAVRADFSVRPDGAPGPADTGQAWLRTGSKPLVVSQGLLTTSGPRVQSAYVGVTLPSAPRLLGARVSFSPDQTADAAMAIIVSGGPGLRLNHLGVFYTVTPTGWSVQVAPPGASPPFPVVGSGSFAVPLTADGTVYPLRLELDGDTLTIRQPDGSSDTVSDPRIGANVSGAVAWGVTRGGASPAMPGLREVWAD